MADKRNRPSREVTLAQDIDAYLDQDHLVASRVVENAIRQMVPENQIEQAARSAGMTKEEIEEARES